MFLNRVQELMCLKDMHLFYVWVYCKVTPIRIEIMLGGFQFSDLVLKHHLVYSHVTDWRMINDKAHPIKGFAFAKRPLFISWTWHTKNSEK